MATSTYNFSSEPLIQSCPLPKSMISHKGKSGASLTVTAEKIEPLSSFIKRHKKHLEYEVIETLIESIGRQLQHLERENMGIASFNIDDITVFHAHAVDTDTDADTTATYTATTTADTTTADTTATVHFAITNDDKIHEINEDHHLVINAPYPKEYTNSATATTKNKGFHSPEFKEFISKKKVPYEIHFKSGYYSFGLLCMYCYVSRATTHTTTHTPSEKHLDEILAPIINTKIYWFLKQVLQENPTSRRYICV
jgi:hypothetical protein